MRFALLLAVVSLSGCYIDFRDGLQCRTNKDCFGFVCSSNVCKAGTPDGGEAGSDGGLSQDGDLSLASYVVYDGTGSGASGNNDGVLNRNETVRVNVKIQNLGSTAIKGVSGTLSTTSSLATVEASAATQSFSDIEANSYSCLTSCDYANSTNAFLVTVPGTTPDGSSLPFTLALTDTSGDHWSLSFSLTVTPLGAGIVLVSQVIYDGTGSSAAGNNDGVLNRNETVRLNVKVKNTGTSRVLAATATLSTTSNLATLDAATTTQSLGDIDQGSTACLTSCDYANSTNTFRLTVPVSTPDGSVIPFQLLVTDSSGNHWPLNLSLTVAPLGASPSFVSFAIYDGTGSSAAGNNDGVPNKGETVRLNIKVRNSGMSRILGLSGTLSTSSSLATIDSTAATQSFGDVDGQSTACLTSCDYANSVSTFRVTLRSTATDYADIPLSLALTDNAGNQWTLPIDLRVYPLGAVVMAASVLYDATSGAPLQTDGNGNGYWEAGETIRLNLGLRNTGTGNAVVSSATLTTTSSAVTILSMPTSGYGTVSGGSTGWLGNSQAANQANTWRLSLAPGTAPGTVIPFHLTMTNGTTTWQDWFSATTH
jgi:hypothetical protein